MAARRENEKWVNANEQASIIIVNADGSPVSAGGGGGTSSTDDAAFVVGVSSLTPVGGIVTSDSVDSGDTGAFKMLANRQQVVTLADSSGVEITSFGGGTEYTEDAASAADPKGGMLMLRRRDALNASEVSGDGDNIAGSSTSKGELYVKHVDAIPVTDNGGSLTVDNGGTFAVQAAQSGTWNITNVSGTVSLPTGAATAAKQPALGTAGTASSDVITVQGITSMTPLLVTASAGTNLNTSALALESGGNLATIAALSRAEDAAHASGHTGIMGLSVRQDTAAALAGTDADYQPLITDASGRLHVNVGNTVTVGSHAVTNAGTFAVQATIASGATSIAKAEDVASADADVGVPSLAVRKATPANTSGTDGDYEFLQMSAGRLWTSTTIDAALPAGTAAIGKLAANDGVDIGDVTINNASGASAVNIQDGGNSITVDGTVSVNTHDVGAITTSVTPGTSAAHLGKAEDAAHGSGDTGVMALAVRRDADTTLADTTGDYAPLQVNAAGSLKVAITSGAGSGGTSIADEAAFTIGSTSLTPIGGQYNSTLDSLADGSAGIAHMTVKRALHVNLRDASGNELSVGGGTQYAIDSVASATATGTVALVVRKDAAASLAGTDGDISGLQVDANGALRVTGGGGGTEYVVNDVAPANPTGATFVMERDDALSALTEVEGDWTNPRSNANGALWTAIDGTVTVASHAVTNAGTFVVQENGAALTALQLIDDIVYTDDTSTHATGTSKGALFMAAATPTDASVNANDIGAVAMTTDRKLHVSVQDALPAGTAAIGKLAANSGVDIGDVDVTSITPGTTATSLGKAEDAAHSSGDVGVMGLSVRQDTAAALAGTDADYQPLITDASGRLWVNNSGVTQPVSGTVAATQSGTWTVQPGNTANTTAWKVDGSAVTQPVSLAAGAAAIAKAEDVASADADVGVPSMAVRKATPANTSGADGDYEFLQMSAGRLWASATIDAALPAGANAIGKLAANSGVDIGDVDVTSITPGTTATSLGKAEDAGHSSGDVGVMALSVRQDTAAALAGTDADYQPLITDASGRLHVNVGNTVTVGSHAVTNAGTFAVQATLAAGAAAIAKAEDVASADADVGVPSMMVRKATPANTSGTDGDYEFLQGSAGRLWVDASGVTLTVASHAVTNAGTFAVQAVAAGDIAHDGADSGNPVKIGARARSSEIAAVANNDRSDLLTDLVGKLIVLPYANPENFVSGAITTAMTGTTTTSLIAAPAAGLRNYITTIICSNAHATVGTDIIIQDGSGGTTLLTIPAAAVYGGAAITLPTPLRQPTTATALFCANVTTGASTKVSAVGYKGA